MSVVSSDPLDRKLASLYLQKTTVNLETKSTISPDEFWNSMSMIAMNNRAMMNFKVK